MRTTWAGLSAALILLASTPLRAQVPEPLGLTPTPITPVWEAFGPSNSTSIDAALTKDGGRLYVAGIVVSGENLWLGAYDTSSGAEAWSFTSGQYSQPKAVAVSPTGHRVAVGGWMSPNGNDRSSQMSVWMLKANGTNLWQRRFTGNGADRGDWVSDLVFSPDGKTVYSTGITWFESRRRDIIVDARDSTSGKLKWRRVIDSGRGSRVGISEEPFAIEISPNGSTLIVGGYNARPAALSNEKSRAVTMALAAKDGKTKWSKDSTATGDPNKTPAVFDIAVRGSNVYVAGGSWYRSNAHGFTARHDLSTGQRRWAQIHNPSSVPGGRADSIQADAQRVYLTGPTTHEEFYVWSQAANRGSTSWTAELGPGQAREVALEPDGLLFAAGVSSLGSPPALMLVGLERATGALSWEAETNQGLNPEAEGANALEVGGGKVFAIGFRGARAAVFAFNTPT
jgi:hypothetical protein